MAEGGPRNSACIVSCVKGEDTQLLHALIEELTGQSVSTRAVDKSSVTWSVDNKYYSARIELSTIISPETWDDKREHQAIIFLCNLDKLESLDSMKSLWTQLLGDSPNGGTLPEVRVVMGVSTSETPYSDVLKWCVGEGIELIEWERGGSPLPQDTDSDDGLPPEAVGVARLSETLQAHMWPDMTMKGRDPTTVKSQAEGSDVKSDEDSTSEGLKKLEAKAAATGASKEESQKRVDDLLLTEEQLSALRKKEDPGGESFEDLFSRFAQMKSHAESLPHEERKAYAEKVVMAFWNAIGGDEDETAPPTD